MSVALMMQYTYLPRVPIVPRASARSSTSVGSAGETSLRGAGRGGGDGAAFLPRAAGFTCFFDLAELGLFGRAIGHRLLEFVACDYASSFFTSASSAFGKQGFRRNASHPAA